MRGRERVQLLLSTPLWCQVKVGEPGRLVLDVPTWLPRDTWFGPSTREGELCYASRTTHHVQFEQILALPHRATTAVRVRNRAESMLSLERMLLPVQRLSLYQAADGRLWTNDVVFTRTGSDDFAALRTRSRANSTQIAEAKRIARPRYRSGDHPVVRAFSSIFR